MPAPVKAIIIDDDELLRMTLRAVLGQLGVAIIGEAENGREGVDLVVESQPDLILLDIKMPVMDGVSALDELMGRMHEPFIVMVTSVEDEDIAKQARLAGAQDYVFKTMPVSVMINRLKDHIDFLAKR